MELMMYLFRYFKRVKLAGTEIRTRELSTYFVLCCAFIAGISELTILTFAFEVEMNNFCCQDIFLFCSANTLS